MTKVSIIVPVYNVEEYLDKCLNSLVNQTIDNYEVIVVNDGTKDNSQEIIDKYVKEYPKIIKPYIKKNGGLSDARNYGLKYARGEYIGFVDSDDYVKEDMFEKMYNKATENNYDIVVCDCIVKDKDTEYILKSNLNLSDNVVDNYILSYPMAWIRLVKKEVINNFKFRKGILYEDLDLTPTFVLKSKKIGFLEYGCYYYVQRPGSIMKQKEFNNRLLDIFDVLSNVKDKIGDLYPLEVEYLFITHLLRTATLRFLDYDNTNMYLERIINVINEYYPNWKENIYFKKSGSKIKIICNLSYKKRYRILKFMKKITGK